MRLLLRVAFIAIAIVLALLALMFGVRLAYEWDVLPAVVKIRHGVWIGVCVAAIVAMRVTDRSLARKAVLGEVVKRAEGFSGDRLAVRADPGKVVIMALMALFLLGIGITLLARRPFVFDVGLLGGVASLLLGGLVLAGLVLFLVQPGPALLLDAEGIRFHQFGRVPWHEIVGLKLVTIPGGRTRSHQLKLGVRDAKQWHARRPFVLRWAGVGSRDDTTLTLPLALLDANPHVIEAAALALRDRVDPPRMKSWFPGMPVHLAEAQSRFDASSARLDELMQQLQAIEAQVPATGATARQEAEIKRLQQAVDATIGQLEQASDAMLGKPTR